MNYTIYRLSDEKDKENLLKFWNENHEKDLDEKYKWIYEGNPAGKATVFLVKDNEYPIGCFAVFPRRLSINGVNLRAGVGGDFHIHKKHRILGPALKLVKSLVSIVQENEFDLIYGFPNKNAEPVMKRAGFKCLGRQIRIAKIIRTSEQIKKLHFNKYFNKLLSPLLDVALKLSAFETWYRFKGGFICEEISNFDERFDKLWMKSKSRFQIVGERTSEFLTWKYLKKPDAEYKIFALLNSNRTELKGYIVYCMDEDSIRITDFIFPEDKKTLRVLVAHFMIHVRKEPIRSVIMQLYENKEILKLFKRFGFVIRKSDWNVYNYCNEQVLKRFPALEEPENWVLTDFDMEN